MMFHKIVKQNHKMSFGPVPEKNKTITKYTLDYQRIKYSFMFLILLPLSAFIAWWSNWEMGAATFLHLTEVIAGGLIGVFLGERSALNKVKENVL